MGQSELVASKYTSPVHEAGTVGMDVYIPGRSCAPGGSTSPPEELEHAPDPAAAARRRESAETTRTDLE